MVSARRKPKVELALKLHKERKPRTIRLANAVWVRFKVAASLQGLKSHELFEQMLDLVISDRDIKRLRDKK